VERKTWWGSFWGNLMKQVFGLLENVELTRLNPNFWKKIRLDPISELKR